MATDTTYCEPEGPIIDLFKMLVSSDTKEMTILRNSKLIEILEKEFNMDTTELHALEIDIYLNVLKTYIKLWPGWDNFDKITDMEAIKDKESISKTFKEEYVKLKDYLQNILNLSKELATDKVNKLKEKEISKKDIVMEVEATRQQLNILFHRSPVENNIFNISNEIKTRKYSKFKSIESILNWTGIEILIHLKTNEKYIIYERRNPHKLKHTLVNNKLNLKTNNIKLDQNILVKTTENSIQIQKTDIIKYFKELNSVSTFNSIFNSCSSIIKNDLDNLPSLLEVPSTFKKYASQYNYVRYLNSNQPLNYTMDIYDLRLEEIISPMWEFKIDILNLPCNLDESVEIICNECQITFTGSDVSQILIHFKKDHSYEPDWICMNCKKFYTAISLTYHGWYHDCDSISRDETDIR